MISEEIHACPECNGALVNIPETCSVCGLVVGEYGFDGYDKNSMQAEFTPTNFKGIYSGSRIYNRDLRRIFKNGSRTNSTNRTLQSGLYTMYRVKDHLKIPYRVTKYAKVLLEKCSEVNIFLGRSVSSYVGACLIYSSKFHGVPYDKGKICELIPIEVKKLSKAYSLMLQGLKLRNLYSDGNEFIPGICSKLGLNYEVVKKVREFHGSLPRMIFNGKDPKGFVAGSVYIVSKRVNDRRTQKEIAKIMGVTEVTLRSRVGDIGKLSL